MYIKIIYGINLYTHKCKLLYVYKQTYAHINSTYTLNCVASLKKQSRQIGKNMQGIRRIPQFFNEIRILVDKRRYKRN